MLMLGHETNMLGMLAIAMLEKVLGYAIATCCTSEMPTNKFVAASSVCKRFT